MSAEVLRRAASLMRERVMGVAEEGMSHRWTADTRLDGRAWVGDGIHSHELAMHGFPSTAEHIASWHPTVALAVAHMLDLFAADWNMMSAGEPGQRALAVARAYLGELS